MGDEDRARVAVANRQSMTLQQVTDQLSDLLMGESLGKVAAVLAAHPRFRVFHDLPVFIEWIAREISRGQRPLILEGGNPSADSQPALSRGSASGSASGNSEGSWDELLHHVLTTEDVEVFLQPIVDLRERTVVGYEALARFAAGPDPIAADRWFEAATERGLRNELEALAMRAALRRLAGAPRNCYLSVNVSPHGLASDQVQRVLFETNDLRGVAIELTAPANPAEVNEVADRVAAFREAGATLTITDSLGETTRQELSALRPSVLKLTSPHFSGIERLDPSDAVIVVHRVEQMRDLLALQLAGVRFVQGFIAGVPTTSWQPLASAINASVPR